MRADPLRLTRFFMGVFLGMLIVTIASGDWLVLALVGWLPVEGMPLVWSLDRWCIRCRCGHRGSAHDGLACHGACTACACVSFGNVSELPIARARMLR